MTPKKKDDLFSRSGTPEKFEFNAAVANVFDDMLKRSIPFYQECQTMVVALAVEFCRDDTFLYDLGCSTGTLLKQLAQTLPTNIQLVGLDNSRPMLDQARRKLKGQMHRCQLVEQDLLGRMNLENASVIIMNYTLQFAPPEKRATLLRKIFKSLRPGGAFILVEKVLGESQGLNEVFIRQYHDLKRERGYSRLEIARKREALENVLVPFKPSRNVKLLHSAGFKNVDIFFKWFNFAGYLAVKPGGKPKG